MTSMDGRIWLRDGVIKGIPGRRGIIDVYEPVEETDADVETCAFVVATSEQFLRWQAANKAFEQAQQEMGELFTTYFNDQANAEQAAWDAEETLREEEAAAAEAERVAKEAALDAEYGPRAWLSISRSEGRNIRYTIHHVDCRFAKADDYDRRTRALRLPEAIKESQLRPYGYPVNLCQHCCAPLESAIAAAGLELPVKPEKPYTVKRDGKVALRDGTVIGHVSPVARMGGWEWQAVDKNGSWVTTQPTRAAAANDLYKNAQP
jgi:hypothetical protein